MSWTLFSKRFRKALRNEECGLGRVLTFKEFVAVASPKYQWFKHHEVLASVLQRLADGELFHTVTGRKISRVFAFMPPRHGKSEQISRLYSAYYVYRYPERWVAISSYAAGLAYTLSKAARGNFRNAGGQLDPSMRAVKQWQTTEGGGLWATGVGGEATGKGWHLGIIDDPVKNAEEATSLARRNKLREWYQSVWYTRQEENAIEAFVMTRWNKDDLAGWLLQLEQLECDAGEDGDPDGWWIVYLPAICDEPEEVPVFPASCYVEPDWRQPGEALWPEKYGLAKLRRVMVRVGSYFWNALYMQKPRPKTGGFFDVENIELIPAGAVPRGLMPVRAWDLAATQDGGDATAGVKLAGPCAAGFFYILDLKHGHLGEGARDTLILRTAQTDTVICRIRGPQDPGQAGKTAAAAFVRMLRGFAVKVLPVTGAKEVRARPVASAIENHMVKCVIAPWTGLLLDELRDFPYGEDNIVDALADAYAEATGVEHSVAPLVGGDPRGALGLPLPLQG